MNGTGSALKKAIVATICEHPQADKYRQAAFIESPEDLVKSLSQRVTLTKADFLSADDEGKAFMDTPGAWKNFEKISTIIQLHDEKFTYEDFTAPLVQGATRTLLDSAKSNSANNALKQVFSFDMWKGRYAEMEKLWYHLPSYERNKVFTGGLTVSGATGLIPLDLKRQLLAEEGKKPPEDRLAKAGLTLEDLRKSATENFAYEDVNRKLAKAGDYFRKEYVLMVDASGDTMFDGRTNAWNKFSDVLQIMQKHNERLEVADYTRKLANAKSLLERAGEQKTLNKVFAPEQWVDRLDDMYSLWSKVADAWKNTTMTPRGFDSAYASAEGMTYAKSFTSKKFKGREDLLTPLNSTAETKPVLPLGLKVFWDNFEAIQEKLSATGEKLTLADLRSPSGHMGDTCLMIAAKHGSFDKALDVVNKNGETLSLADLTTKDVHGDTLIGVLAEKQQLGLVFTAGVWAGRMDEMRELWTLVSGKDRKQVDFPALETATKQATLKLKRPGSNGGFKPRPI